MKLKLVLYAESRRKIFLVCQMSLSACVGNRNTEVVLVVDVVYLPWLVKMVYFSVLLSSNSVPENVPVQKNCFIA